MSAITETIKAKLNIVEVVGQYVRLQKAGNHWKANCPFHQEKTPSFTVSEERNMWHCFGCGKGGDAFAFLMEIEGIDFREALVTLAERAGVELPRYESGAPYQKEGEKSRSLEILELATRFYEKQLWETSRGREMLEYLHHRGLTDESIKQFRLGYAPNGWRYLSDFLLKAGFQMTELERAGLALRKQREQNSLQNDSFRGQTHGSYDRFRDRIMFPIGDILGRVIGYSARATPGADESQAKYINTAETDVYHKSRVLYGLHLAKKSMKERGRAILVEGNVDVIALHQAGLAETIAVSGTALTEEQLSLIKRYVEKVALFFDMDIAGQKAAWKSTILAQELGLLVEVIALSHGKDAADMGKDDPEELKRMVAAGKPAMRYFLDQLVTQHDVRNPEGKQTMVKQYAELLASLTNTLERAHWTKTLAEHIGLDPKIVQGSIEKMFSDFRTRNTNFAVSSKPFIPKAFTTRSEMLRESILGLMLVGDSTRQAVLSQLTDGLRSFFSEHPLFFFLLNETEDVLGTIEDESLQKEASRLLFQALSLPDISVAAEGGERAAKAELIALEHLNLLPTALAADKRRQLIQEIESARQAGNKEVERQLLEEFAKQAGQ